MEIFGQQKQKTMKLNHIALNIYSKDELKNFYEEILGFQFEYEFDLNIEIAIKIFDIEEQPEVYLYKRDGITIELFHYKEKTIQGFGHICLELDSREETVEKARLLGYEIIRINRNDRPDILFIKDKAGNIVELK